MQILRPLLFETNEEGYVVDERTNWFPDFANLTRMQMTYVAWVTDYNSPLYGHPEQERYRKATEILDIKSNENITEAGLRQAIAFYDNIQYDPLVEQLNSQKRIFDVFTRELNSISKMGDSKSDVERIIKATEMQRHAEREIDRLETKVRQRIVEDSKTRGDRVTNFFYKWKSDQDKRSGA